MMKRAGRSAWYVSGVWRGIAIVNGLAAALGTLLFIGFSDQVIAARIALAAGAILAMLVDTMIPEAFEVAQDYAGIIAVIGFLAAFYLSKISGQVQYSPHRPFDQPPQPPQQEWRAGSSPTM